MKYHAETAFDEALRRSVSKLCIMLESRCNAYCPYCLVEQEMSHEACARCPKNLENCKRCMDGRLDDKEFIERLHYVLGRVVGPFCDISISGGEPSISPRIRQTIDVANKFECRQKSFITNGTGLLSLCAGSTLAEYLMRSGWNIVLHRDHWENDRNEALMGCESLNDVQMQYLCDLFSGRLIIDCIVQTGGVCSSAGVFAYRRYARENWGDVHIRFSEIEIDPRAEGGRTEKSKELYFSIKELMASLETYKPSIRVDNDITTYARYDELNFSLYGCRPNARNQFGIHELIMYPDGDVGWIE